MCGTSYRPRPDNGSGDSPRPPFLTEFVNHIGKLALVEVVYHLFGGELGLRIHPHIERSFRLKTEASRRIGKLQAADAQVSKDPVNLVLSRTSYIIGQFGKCRMSEVDCWPVCLLLLANERRRRTKDGFCSFQRRRISIDPNQMTRCAEAFCDFVTVPAEAHRGVDISPATPDG